MQGEVVSASRVKRRSERTRIRHSTLAIWAALLVLYVGLRSWRLTSYGLWVDEIFSVRAAQLAWPELFRFIATDAVHPPFFYVLLKLWIAAGGATLLWVKLLPLILSITALLPFWLLCQELRLGLTEATLTCWLMAVNGYLIHYSQELRMYSLLFCLSLWSLWLCLRFLSAASASVRVVVPLFVVNVLVVYTHYFGWLLVGTEWLCVLLWRPRLLGWFSLSVSGVTLAFSPWVYAVATSAAKVDIVPGSLQWIARPGWAEVTWYLATLNGILPWRHTTPLGILLFGAPIAFALCRLLGSRQLASARSLEILGVFSFVPIAVSFIASRLLPQSVWGERHLMEVALPYLLMVTGALSYVGRVSVRIALIVLIVTWSSVASMSGMLREEGRIPWKRLAQHMIDEEGPSHHGVKVYASEGWAAAPLGFLFADLGNHQFNVEIGEPERGDGEHFWVVFREPTLWVQYHPRAVLEQRGCRIDAERSADDGGQRVVVLRATC
jgi:uncharacterized membrane protein